MKRKAIAILLLLTLTIGGHTMTASGQTAAYGENAEDIEWLKATKKKNTAPAFSDYLAKHPDGSHSKEAEKRLKVIDWNMITKELFEILESSAPSSIRKKIDVLRGNDAYEKEKAIQELASSDGFPTLALIDVLKEGINKSKYNWGKESQWEIAQKAREALVKIGDVAAWPLIAALGDKNPEIREEIRFIIIGQGRTSAKCLFSALKYGEFVPLEEIILTLKKMRKEVVLPCLLNSLDDQNADIRLGAVLIAGILGYQEAAQKLIDMLDNPKLPIQLRSNAAIALGRIGDQKGVSNSYTSLGDQNPDLKWVATLSLAIMKNDNAVRKLLDTLGDKKSKLSEIESASLVLGKIGKSDAVEFLIPLLRHNNARVREASVWALGMIGDKRGTLALVESLKDQEPDTRITAALSLARLKDYRAIPALIDALEDKNSDLQIALAYALKEMEIRDIKFLEPLGNTLRNVKVDSDAKLLLAQSLVSMGGGAVSYLKDIMKREGNIYAALCLMSMGEEGKRGLEEMGEWAATPLIELEFQFWDKAGGIINQWPLRLVEDPFIMNTSFDKLSTNKYRLHHRKKETFFFSWKHVVMVAPQVLSKIGDPAASVLKNILLGVPTPLSLPMMPIGEFEKLATLNLLRAGELGVKNLLAAGERGVIPLVSIVEDEKLGSGDRIKALKILSLMEKEKICKTGPTLSRIANDHRVNVYIQKMAQLSLQNRTKFLNMIETTKAPQDIADEWTKKTALSLVRANLLNLGILQSTGDPSIKDCSNFQKLEIWLDKEAFPGILNTADIYELLIRLLRIVYTTE